METLLNRDTEETKEHRQVRVGVNLAGACSEPEKPKLASTLTELLKRAYRRDEEVCR